MRSVWRVFARRSGSIQVVDANGSADASRAGPTIAGAPPRASLSRRAVVAPLTEETFKVQFTASRAFRDKLRQAQDLLRHRVPDGDLAAVLERALDLLIEDVKKERFAVGRKARQAPKEGSRRLAPHSRRDQAGGQRARSPPQRPEPRERFHARW